jgi:hypothetical protein
MYEYVQHLLTNGAQEAVSFLKDCDQWEGNAVQDYNMKTHLKVPEIAASTDNCK